MSMLTQWFIGGFYGHFPPTERGLQKKHILSAYLDYLCYVSLANSYLQLTFFVVFLTIFGTFDIRQRERGIFLRYQRQKLVIE